MLVAKSVLFTHASTLVIAGRRRISAINFRETASSAAVATIAFGTSAVDGSVLITAEVAANGSANLTFPIPVSFPNGIYVIAGTDAGEYAGTIWYV